MEFNKVSAGVKGRGRAMLHINRWAKNFDFRRLFKDS